MFYVHVLFYVELCRLSISVSLLKQIPGPETKKTCLENETGLNAYTDYYTLLRRPGDPRGAHGFASRDCSRFAIFG